MKAFWTKEIGKGGEFRFNEPSLTGFRGPNTVISTCSYLIPFNHHHSSICDWPQVTKPVTVLRFKPRPPNSSVSRYKSIF